MRIRVFDLQRDLEHVLKIWGSSAPGIQLSPSDRPEEIRKKIQRDPDLFLVAEDQGQIIGVVMGGFDGRRGMIYHLAVASPHQRRGVGRTLMEELERRLRRKGCLKYYLLVTKQNQTAIAFYEGIGCEVMDLNVLGKVLQ